MSACATLVAVVLMIAAGARAQDEGFVGDEVCVACHAATSADYAHTIHARAFTARNARSPLMRRGCEGCHGPGREHVKAGGGKATEGMWHLRDDGTEDPATQAAVCLECHQSSELLYWDGSPHQASDLSCSSCHGVMKAESPDDLLREKTQTETCARCHLMPRSQHFRNAHMPVREGEMSCGSCHNPHGTVAEGLIRDNTVNENCYRCHAEKRGPFLWEHPPVYEDCLNCHRPHGSTRRSMLKLSLPRLCQQCHVDGHPGNPRDSMDRFAIGSSCLQCHGAIHGSNHPAGNAFTR